MDMIQRRRRNTKVTAFLAFFAEALLTLRKARLIATLTVVQNKLSHLEAENSVSRRRVRELELELEACKKEVARERTRILEQSAIRDENTSVGPRSRRSQQPQHKQQQQQKKAQEDEAELAAAEARYKAAVEEKKGMCLLCFTSDGCSSLLQRWKH